MEFLHWMLTDKEFLLLNIVQIIQKSKRTSLSNSLSDHHFFIRCFPVNFCEIFKNAFFNQIIAPEENYPPLGLGFGSRWELGLGLVEQPDYCPREKSPPIRGRLWLRVNFGAVGQLSSEAIVLEHLRWLFLKLLEWWIVVLYFETPLEVFYRKSCS